MEDIKWIYEPIEAQLFGCCDCCEKCSPDVPGVCAYVSDYLVTVVAPQQ